MNHGNQIAMNRLECPSSKRRIIIQAPPASQEAGMRIG